MAEIIVTSELMVLCHRDHCDFIVMALCHRDHCDFRVIGLVMLQKSPRLQS